MADNDKNVQFTPLNISYPIQKYSNWLLIGGAIGVITSTVGIILTVKVHTDLMFSSFFGSPLFTVLGIIVSLYIGIFLFRKIGLREGELLRNYKDMLDHELTTINDLWDVSGVDGNIVTMINGECRIFLRCEKGYTVSRNPNHVEQHFSCLEAFIRYLSQKGYYIRYYDWRNRDANTEPLIDLERNLRGSKNKALQRYGNSVIKFCRDLEYECTDSQIDYFMIESRDQELSTHLQESVLAAVECLEGSLYEDIRLCDIGDIVDFIELLYKIQGVNVNEMLLGNALKTEQVVVTVLRVYGYDEDEDADDLNEDKNNSDESNPEEDEAYLEFMKELEEDTSTKKSKSKRNLANKNGNQKTRKHAVSDTYEDDEDIPILIDDEDDTPVPVDDDTPVSVDDDTLVPVYDDDEDNNTVDMIENNYNDKKSESDDDELLDDDDTLLDDDDDDTLLDDDDDDLLD